RTAPSVRVGRGQAGRRGQAGAAVERGERGIPGADTGARGQGPRGPAGVVGRCPAGVGGEVGGLAGDGPATVPGLVDVARVRDGQRRQVAAVAPAVRPVAVLGELDAVAVVPDGQGEDPRLVHDGDLHRDAVGVARATAVGQLALPDDEVADLALEAVDAEVGGAGAGLEQRGHRAVMVTVVRRLLGV